MTERDYENYVWLVKTISEAGFVWSKGAQSWQRQRDDAAISDEALLDVVRTWPAFVPRIAAAFEQGVKGFVISADANDDPLRWTVTFEPSR